MKKFHDTPQEKVNPPTESFHTNHFKLNQTDFIYVRHLLPIKISSCVPEGKHYIFHLQDENGTQSQVVGDTAIIIEPTSIGNEDNNNSIRNIRIVVLKFDNSKLHILLEARFGSLFSSVPWRTGITEGSKHLILIRSLTLWVIQEKIRKSPPLISWLHIEKALLELFVDNLDRRTNQRQDDYELKKKWFVELESWIENNLTNTILLEDLAKVSGVSVRTIQKAFRQYRGCTPMNDINRRRMEKARKMLLSADKNLTVLDVVLDVGYQHPSRFAALYKKRYGENPSQTLAKSRKGINQATEC